MTTPPFTGTIDFDLTIRALGERVLRKVRAIYTYTPQWPYFHTPSQTERTSDPRLDLGLTLLAIPRSDMNRIGQPIANDPYWVPVGQLLTVGVLRKRVYDELRARIDAEALEADRRNRISAGLSVPPQAECI
jgi:hypothetical protein